MNARRFIVLQLARAGVGMPTPQGGAGGFLTQQAIADTYLGVDGWHLKHAASDPVALGWTIVGPTDQDLDDALAAATAGDILYLTGARYSGLVERDVNKKIGLRGSFDVVTTFDGRRTVGVNGWTNNGDGTWQKAWTILPHEDDSWSSGAYDKVEDRDGFGERADVYSQQLYINGKRAYHYWNRERLKTRKDNEGLNVIGNPDGYHLDEAADLIVINFDPNAVSTIEITEGQQQFDKTENGYSFYETLGMLALDSEGSTVGGIRLQYGATSFTQYMLRTGSRSVVEYCDGWDTHGGGIKISDYSIKRHCRAKRCGSIGLNIGLNKANGVNDKGGAVIANCEMSYCGHSTSIGYSAGGQKILRSGHPDNPNPYGEGIASYDPDVFLTCDAYHPQMAIKHIFQYRCWSHHNRGNGFWYDHVNYHGEVSHCIAEHNAGPALNSELNGPMRWHHNHLIDSGHSRGYDYNRAGAHISASQGLSSGDRIDIYNNYIEGCVNAVTLLRPGRTGDSDGGANPVLVYELKHIRVYGNHIVSRGFSYQNQYNGQTYTINTTRAIALHDIENDGKDVTSAAFDINIDGNYYEYDEATEWKWGGTTYRSIDAWRAAHPTDAVANPPAGVPLRSEVGVRIPPGL